MDGMNRKRKRKPTHSLRHLLGIVLTVLHVVATHHLDLVKRIIALPLEKVHLLEELLLVVL